MPAIPTSTVLTNVLLDRDLNATADALQVVCAWPVSGQYGPGSRVLYYVLVVACLLARKVEWLKKACLAAALLLPAVAAIHGIVLAIVHTDDAVDMDVYGAFQLCAIGILAAPVTVKLSSTYFNDRGRNIIFAWTGLILAGLLSLTVEFYRINPKSCSHDNVGNPLNNSNPSAFPYGAEVDGQPWTCDLACDIGPGNPYSPMRDWYGSTNNIYVVPAPNVLTFGTGTLLAAACCVPAILSLVSMWNRIAEFNWRQRFFPKTEPEPDEMIEGTNGATTGQMKSVQEDIKKYLKISVEIPVFGAAVMAILILGEKNFWSAPVKYQTEPMASVGQWGPIVGTGLAALGSLYLLVAKAAEEEAGSESSESKYPQYHHHENMFERTGTRLSPRRDRGDSEGSPDSLPRSPGQGFGTALVSTISRRSHATAVDAGNRRKFASVLNKVGNYIGTPSRKRFDYSDFRDGAAMNYPEIPGEINRNRELSRLSRIWPAPSIREQPSRDGSPDSRIDIDDGASSHGRESPQSPQSPASIQWPTMPPRTARANTLPTKKASVPLPGEPSSSTVESRGRERRRRDTLEVPSSSHPFHTRNSLSASSIPTIALPASENSPAIVVSPEPEPEPEASPPQRTLRPDSSPLQKHQASL